MRLILLFIFITLITIPTSSHGQSDTTRYKTVQYYFELLDEIETNAYKKAGLLDDSLNLKPEYLDENNKLNDDGIKIYANVKPEVYLKFFSKHYYLQDLKYKDKVYGLYFTVAGFDDIEFNLVGFDEDNWKGPVSLTRSEVEDEVNLNYILFNYDEGPKNLENVRIFSKDNYLVMERSGLYYSLFDMNTEEVIYNEISPVHRASDMSAEGVNEYIRNNLHNPIKKIIQIE